MIHLQLLLSVRPLHTVDIVLATDLTIASHVFIRVFSMIDRGNKFLYICLDKLKQNLKGKFDILEND